MADPAYLSTLLQIEQIRRNTALETAHIHALSSDYATRSRGAAEENRLEFDKKTFDKNFKFNEQRQKDRRGYLETALNNVGNFARLFLHRPAYSSFYFSSSSGRPLDRVWTDQEIESQVNSQKAAIDASVVNQMNAARTTVASKGYGGDSPLSLALQLGSWNAGLAAKADAEREIRWKAAEKDADMRIQNAQIANQRSIANSQSATQTDAINQRANSDLLSAWTSLYQALGNV